MARINQRREKLYATYREELAKWQATLGTVFARPIPIAEEYGITEWEGMALRKAAGIAEAPKKPAHEVTPADPPYHPPEDVDNEPY